MPEVHQEEPATAPEIPGYTYVRPIGHGGFSDVYLYEQEMPRREVAIKVLRTEDLSEGVREQFAAEANLMARVSNHSNIAAIYAADVDDEGQPYLVMEFCSGGSLGAFYRHYPMSVKDVLTLGIRLSGALEAAHRAGIVHRDVKPANILLTEYGVPVLTDFGISTIDEELPESTRTMHTSSRPGTGESSVGMSLPWAAPETLWETPVSDARSDRYSLAATLYSLLEGRSPHEVPGGPNSAAHLTGRIKSGFIGAMKRPDLPPSLQEMLRRGLSHDRDARYDSAADMGRALQDVQRDLGLEVTPLEVPRGSAPTRPPEPTTRVQQDQPIMLPEGHATLAPPDDGAAPGSGSVTSGASHPGPVAQPATGVPVAQVASFAQPPAPAWSGSSAKPWDPPAGAQVATAAAAPTARGSRLRVAYGVLIAVLVVACVVVASLLIAQANRGPTYSGRAVDNLEATATSTGAYEVRIPDGLPAATEVEARTLETGDGESLSTAFSADISTDSASWGDGETVSLNPMESANLDGATSLAPEELAEALGVEVGSLHSGDVILVAAPYGYFSNTHPDLGIKV
uniref:serine/threonine-protein kinase n=1 Tax=Pseudactinotalea sp. TaxID=1926260 RepID=UPI003B3BC35A